VVAMACRACHNCSEHGANGQRLRIGRMSDAENERVTFDS